MIALTDLLPDKTNLPKKVRPLKKKLWKPAWRRPSKKLPHLKSNPPPRLKDPWAVEVAVAEIPEETTTEVAEPAEEAAVVAEKNKLKKEKTLTLTKITQSSRIPMMTKSITRLLLAQPQGTRKTTQRSRVTWKWMKTTSPAFESKTQTQTWWEIDEKLAE
jgi:hypothetical protein